MTLTREYGESTRLFWERWYVAPDSYVLQQELIQIKIAFTSSLSDNWVDDYFNKQLKDKEGIEYLKFTNLIFLIEAQVPGAWGTIGELKEAWKIFFNSMLELAGETARVLSIDFSTKKFNWLIPLGGGLVGVGAVAVLLKRRK